MPSGHAGRGELVVAGEGGSSRSLTSLRDTATLLYISPISRHFHSFILGILLKGIPFF